MEFYGKIVPKFNQKLKILGELDLVAEPFGIWKKENILILEDLSAKGYQAQSPAQGFDVHETRAVLKRAATFHAICAVLQEEQSDIFGNFKAGTLAPSSRKLKRLNISRELRLIERASLSILKQVI